MEKSASSARKGLAGNEKGGVLGEPTYSECSLLERRAESKTNPTANPGGVKVGCLQKGGV